MTPDDIARMDAEDAERERRLANPDALLHGALWYAMQGIPVFPCMPNGKQPLTRHGFKDATTHAQQIQRWWEHWPLANIAAPTGVKFDVIDVDGPEGVVSIAEVMETLRPTLIGKVSTPRDGGLHFYLPPHSGRRNGAKVMPGVDTRASGGYVLMPPSVTDEHGPGRRYRWLVFVDIEGVTSE